MLFGEANDHPEFVYLKTEYEDGESEQSLTILPYLPHDGYEAIEITISQIQCRINAREQSEVLRGGGFSKSIVRSVAHLL